MTTRLPSNPPWRTPRPARPAGSSLGAPRAGAQPGHAGPTWFLIFTSGSWDPRPATLGPKRPDAKSHQPQQPPRRFIKRSFRRTVILVAVAVSIAGLASGGCLLTQGPRPAHFRHVLIEEYAAIELSRSPAGARFIRSINNSATYEIWSRHVGADALPRATHVAVFDSYQAIRIALQMHALPNGTRVILYDDERWPGTPLREQERPFYYVREAADLAHRHGFAFANSPAPDLTTTLHPHWRGNYVGYLREDLALLARYSDIFDIQAQHADSVAWYARFTRAAVAQARAANRRAVILLGVTTNGESAADLVAEVTRTDEEADGYWLNVVGPSAPQVMTRVIQKLPA